MLDRGPMPMTVGVSHQRHAGASSAMPRTSSQRIDRNQAGRLARVAAVAAVHGLRRCHNPYCGRVWAEIRGRMRDARNAASGLERDGPMRPQSLMADRARQRPRLATNVVGHPTNRGGSFAR